MSEKKENRYKQLLERIFFDKDFGAYEPGKTDIAFEREDLQRAASILGLKLPKNLGDVFFAARYRGGMPQRIVDTQEVGKIWLILGAGRSRYRFRLKNRLSLAPEESIEPIELYDATPRIIRQYAINDEQALLSIVRNNRLIDMFLGLTAYSLQNHMRTTVSEIGQIEIDEVYIGVSPNGKHVIVPVQAKCENDQLGMVQAMQDIIWCMKKHPDCQRRAVSVQFLYTGTNSERIALFELAMEGEELVKVQEKHYRICLGA